MDDLSATINKVLSDPESLRQLQEVAASLGLSPGGSEPAGALPPPAQSGGGRQSSPPLNWTMGAGAGRGNNRRQGQSGQNHRSHEPPPRGDDLGYIKSMLEQLVENTKPAPSYTPPPEQTSSLPDLSALSGVLNGLGGGQQSGSGGPDLSALSGILGNLSGGQPTAPAAGGGLDMSALSGILNGLGGGQSAGSGSPDLSALPGILGNLTGGQPAAPAVGGGLDMSGLSGILNGLGGGQSAGSGGPDLSALSGILGNLTGGQPAQQTPASGVSALTSMLGGDAGSSGGSPPAGGGMNMGMLLKFQQALSGINANAENVRLMMALKSQLKDEARIAKVDDALKVMQVVQFLPLLKESGIFGGLDEMLAGLPLGGLLGGQNTGGGLGSLLSSLTGNAGGGLSGLLGSLTGRR